MTGNKLPKDESVHKERLTRPERSARWWTSPIRALSDEASTLPGKLNIATVAILAGMCMLAFLALLVAVAFELKVKWAEIEFATGGKPVPVGIVALAMIAIWLVVTVLSIRSYLESK